MSRFVIAFGILTLGIVLSVSGTAPVPEKPRGPVRGEPQSLTALRTVWEEFPEVPSDPATKLPNILNALSTRLQKDHNLQVNFSFNMPAFLAEGLNEEKVLELALVADKPMPKMSNVTLEHYLHRLIYRINEKGPIPSGAAILVRRDGIEITTNAALRKQIWGDHPGPYLPLVHANIDRKPLDEALRELAEQSEHNIVVDPRAGEKAQTKVTARFLNTPLDTAVKFLADMAELSLFLQDNTIYVTTRDNAIRLEARHKRENPDDADGGPRTRVGTGVRGFLPHENKGGMN